MSSKIVPLDMVLPGAVLGDNVHDAAGRVLLRNGAIVTEAAIEALRRRGIESVPIAVVEVHSPEHQAHERAQLEVRMHEAFRHAGSGEANRQLWQAVLEYKLGVD